MIGISQKQNRNWGNLKFGQEAQAQIAGDKLSLFIFLFCLFSILVQVSLILSSWHQLPLEIPLFYSRPWGKMTLSSTAGLWLMPLVTTLVMLINFLMAIFTFKEHRFLWKTLVIFGGLVAFATLYNTVKIISLLI